MPVRPAAGRSTPCIASRPAAVCDLCGHVGTTLDSDHFPARPRAARGWSGAALCSRWRHRSSDCARLRPHNLRFTPRQHAIFALQGSFMYGVSYVCVYHAEQHVVSGLVAVGYSASPLVAGLGAPARCSESTDLTAGLRAGRRARHHGRRADLLAGVPLGDGSPATLPAAPVHRRRRCRSRQSAA